MSANRRIRTPRERRRQKLAFWALCAGLVVYAVLGGDYKLYHLVYLSSERGRLERRIDDLRAENTVLEAEERRLASDTLLLERLAREKGMKKDGEIVYRLLPVTPSPGTESVPREEGESP